MNTAGTIALKEVAQVTIKKGAGLIIIQTWDSGQLRMQCIFSGIILMRRFICFIQSIHPNPLLV